MNEENRRMVEALKARYRDDAEALELIGRTEQDIDYLERREAEAGYTGQSARQHILELEAFLHDWY